MPVKRGETEDYHIIRRLLLSLTLHDIFPETIPDIRSIIHQRESIQGDFNSNLYRVAQRHRVRHAFHFYRITSVQEHGFESVKEKTIFWSEQELMSQHTKKRFTRVALLVL